MAPVTPGEPRESPKPQPIGSFPMIFLFTTCMMCILFILWRRADTLRSVISYRLKTWKQPEGQIRLSLDEGPPAREFLEDDYDEDNADLDLEDDEDDEPLTERVKKATTGSEGRSDSAQAAVRLLHTAG